MKEEAILFDSYEVHNLAGCVKEYADLAFTIIMLQNLIDLTEVTGYIKVTTVNISLHHYRWSRISLRF